MISSINQWFYKFDQEIGSKYLEKELFILMFLKKIKSKNIVNNLDLRFLFFQWKLLLS